MNREYLYSFASFVFVILLSATVLIFAYQGVMHTVVTPTWNCIEPADGIGWAMFCEVGECNVLFYGDDFVMECGQ